MYITKIIEFSKYALALMLITAFALQFITYILCTNYKKTAENIHNSTKEIFRSLKLRFTNFTKLNIPLTDTTSFVEKYFYNKGGPFYIAQTLDHFSGYMLCTSLIIATSLYVNNFYSDTQIITFISIAVCFFVFRATLCNEKQMHLTISYTTDYLDNTLKHRLNPKPLRNSRMNKDISSDNMSLVKAEPINNNTSDNKIDTNNENTFVTSEKTYITEENTDVIDAILKEYFA